MGYSDLSTRKPPLSRHQAFVPLIAVWLAALVGGCIAVLPTGLLNAGLAQVPFAIPSFAASQFAVAGLAAVIGAGVGWAAARAIHAVQHRSGRSAVAIEYNESDAEQAETVDAEPVEPLRIVELEDYSQPVGEPETIEAEVIQPVVCEDTVPESEQAADDSALEPAPFDDEPFYADIDLSQLLGAPKVELTEPIEEHVEVGPVVEQSLAADPQPDPQPEPTVELAQTQEPTPEVAPLPGPAAPQLELPQHGKAVNLLRTHETQELAMPQLIERFAVALDDQRRLAESAMHSYSPPTPPTDLTQRLRALVETPQPAE